MAVDVMGLLVAGKAAADREREEVRARLAVAHERIVRYLDNRAATLARLEELLLPIRSVTIKLPGNPRSTRCEIYRPPVRYPTYQTEALYAAALEGRAEIEKFRPELYVLVAGLTVVDKVKNVAGGNYLIRVLAHVGSRDTLWASAGTGVFLTRNNATVPDPPGETLTVDEAAAWVAGRIAPHITHIDGVPPPPPPPDGRYMGI